MRSRILTASLLALICLTPLDRMAAQTCITSGETYTCSVPTGSYSSNIKFDSPTNPNAMPMMVTSQGTVTAPANQSAALSILANGATGTTAGAGQGLTVNNQGALTITAGQGGTFLFGLFSQMAGADGTGTHDDAGLPGGNSGLLSSQQINLTNSGAITINLPSVTVGSGAALFAVTQGGNGSAPYQFNDKDGGAGGQSTGSIIKNTGAITVSLAGSQGFGGLEAEGQGGAGGYSLETASFGTGSAPGGAGGSSSVTNSAPVSVTWKWQNTSSSQPTYGLFGVLAQSLGGDGSFGNGNNGGAGGYGNTPFATVTLNAGGDVTVTQTGSPAANAIGSFYGAGVAAQLIGGNGGNVAGGTFGSTYYGGNAGWAGRSGVTAGQITITDASVATSGDSLPAVLAFAQGGVGGCGGGPAGFGNPACSTTSFPDLNGGQGGFAGNAVVSITASTKPVAISTTGTNSPAVANLVLAGNGGNGGDFAGSKDHFGASNAGNGGIGANAGQVTVTLIGSPAAPITVSTTASASPGISGASIGGSGGNGGQLSDVGGGAGGTGAAGGSSWDVDISLTSTKVTTQGVSSPGIVALSQAGNGGTGGTTATDFAIGAAGGAGNASRNVSVTLDSASSIATTGTDASGIVAQSLSGAGGNAGGVNGVISGAGKGGGTGGNTGTVTVTNGGTISTKGDTARGILVQAVSGGGGSGGSAQGGVLFDRGGTGGSTGSIAAVTITNSGSITTSGADAHGILAQSFSGGGGAGGQAGGLIAAIGGSASTNPLTANAGSVTVNLNSGTNISTSGRSAIGVLGQSLGGGGGDGGGTHGGAVSVGGNGGAGGSGSNAFAVLTSATIKTLGDGAHGIVMQSIGGGGGNAGNAADGLGLFASVTLGGSGGSGGAGGPALINLSGTTSINVQGTKAAGMVVQSVGGGGGTGGEAFTAAVGFGFSASVAVGGAGGPGSSGAQVSSQMVGGSIATGQNPLLVTGPCPSQPCDLIPVNAYNLLPVDAYGVVVQSIGGGGGVGGSATAKALAFAVPVDESNNQVSVAASAALGGRGGSGGGSNYAIFGVSEGGKILTLGQGASGVLLQSIGGGGGAGGDSSATSMAVGYGVGKLPAGAKSMNITADFAIGGTGGSGGASGSVAAALGGTVSVVDCTPTCNVSFKQDPSGAPTSTITTYGDYADGIKAQSIGGGGGDAGTGAGNTQAFGTGTNSMSIGINLGATGGGGGSADNVVVELFPTSAITTWGSNAIGVVAQSIGGGGGASQGGSYSFGGPSTIGLKPTVKVQVGTQGASGGTGGNVSINVEGSIQTHGGDAIGVLAQSIGGGGGLGGSAGSDGSADNPFVLAFNARQGLSNISTASVPFDATLTTTVGGAGGSGNQGGPVAVSVTNGSISTEGDWASAIVAQSIGGGGGKGGTAVATGTGGRPDITVNLNVAVGGTGGTGGDGNTVTIVLSGGTLSTQGFGASAVIAQSIGGGGGIGADGSDGAWGLLAVGTSTGGNAGAGGDAGSVTLSTNSQNKVMTKGEAAEGILLQSIGGGGGIAGSGSSSNISVVRQKIPSSQLSAGGGPGANGAGNTVTFDDTGTTAISTTGNNAFGIVAQSVGGGGGFVKLSQAEINQAVALDSLVTTIGGNATQGAQGNDGGQVIVTLNAGSKITTTGTGAHGIIAQSIGGGGGIVGLPGTAPFLTTTTPSGTPPIANGNGDTVTITNGAAITVSGAGAIGILAQSIGSGGGLLVLNDGSTVFAGSPAASLAGSGGHGNRITVTTTGSVTASGANGIGIFAQSTGTTVSEDGPVTVTVEAAVTGGSGTGKAIQIDGPTGIRDGTVNVGTSGSLQSASGIAVLASGGGAVNVNNQGTITGLLQLNGGKLNNSGTYTPGPTLQHDVDNTGRVIVGGSTAVSNATIDNRGILAFRGTSSAGNAIIVTSNGGFTGFLEAATADKARFVTNAGGTFDISLLSTAGTAAGSIEGAGTYYLGSKQLTVGANSASTTVTGVITDGGLGGGRGGSLVKTGSGVLTLFGANTYTGPTTVSAGMLSVNGSLASTVSLLNGGVLGGNGVIAGLVQVGGALAPGSSIGTLTINGNASKSGGVYQVEVNPQGQSDRVNVSGTATIGGVMVQVLPQPGTYQRNTTYTILNAQGGVSGTYAGASASGFAFMNPVLGYDANNAYLTLATAYAAGAQTPNQRAVGTALDQASATTTGDFNTVLNALANLSTQLGPAALNTISGQPIANFGTVNVEGASLFMNALGQQMALARGGIGGGRRLALAEACEIDSCEGSTRPWSVWGSALGGLGSVAGDGNAGTLTYNFGGAAVGLDYRFDPRFLIGLGVGYAHGTQWTNGFSGQSWTDSVSVAAYGSFTQAGFYADLLAGYAYSGNQVQRQILIPGLSQRTAGGTTGANQFLGQLETGYQLPIWAPAAATLTPFARLQGSTVGQNGFAESGAQSLNLNVAQQTTSSLRTTFGAELAGSVPLGTQQAVDLALRLGWQHEYASTARPITAAFNGAPFAAFTVYGATPPRDAAIIGFAAKTRLTDAMQLYLRYDGQLGGGADNHALNVGLRMSW